MPRFHINQCLALTTCLLLTGAAAVAEEEVKEGKFLVLPIFITEPAIGEGLGLGLVYFHAQKPVEPPKILTAKEVQRVGRRSKTPPTASGVFEVEGRYTFAERWAGLDFAGGPEEDAWYIQVGHPW